MNKHDFFGYNFATFIISHGRPDRQRTLATLNRLGYSGQTYIIIDNEDNTADEYRKKYRDIVITFDKSEVAKRVDVCDNFDIGRKSAVFARNEVYNIARNIGLDYFLVLDDDYTHFETRITKDFSYKDKCLHHFAKGTIDKIFAATLEYFASTNIAILAYAQGGDFIGGGNSGLLTAVKRKAMNTFFCKTSYPVTFVGRINEDTTTYAVEGHRGHVFLTVYAINVIQPPTQSVAGGLTEAYLEFGTYFKSFYTVMVAPSMCKISAMGPENPRIHHYVTWENACPKIVSGRFKKGGDDNG